MMHETYQMARLSTLTKIVEEAVDQASDNDRETPAPSEAFDYNAAIFANWNQSGPTVAALYAFAHTLGRRESTRLVLVIPDKPDLADRTALAVVVDAVSGEETLPHVVLLSRDDADDIDFDAAYEPKYDETDLLALAGFTNALFDMATGVTAEGRPVDHVG